jgi:hypothetical protein
VRDLREHRVPASDQERADLEADVLAGFVLARAWVTSGFAGAVLVGASPVARPALSDG